MKLRFISVLLAVLLLLYCVAPAEVKAYRDVTYEEWCNMSIEEQYEYIADLVAETGGRACDWSEATATFLMHSSSEWLYRLVTGDALNVSDNYKYLLEWWGIADYGLGVYGVDNWSEDTNQYIDDKYAEYLEQHPYIGILQFDANGQALLDNGCYIKLVVNSQYTHTSTKDKHQTFFSVVLYDASGAKIKKLDMYDKITLEGGNANEYSCYSTLGTCDGVLGFELMDGTTGTYAIRFLVYDSSVGDFVTKVKYFGLTSALLGDDADNATPVNPDDTAIDPDNVSDDYMDDFMNWLIDLLINQYGKDIEFDDSGIIEALNSIYSKLHAILTAMEKGFNNVVSKLDGVIGRLENVITAINKINISTGGNPDEDTESFILTLLDLMDKFKKKVGLSALEKNIDELSAALFGERVFETDAEGETVASYITADGTVKTTSVAPHLYITLFDKQYDLFGSVGKALSDTSVFETFKSIVSLFLWAGFMLGLYRSLPSIIGSVGAVIGISSEVISDTSDNGFFY